jgi:hypothetical protein
LREATSAPVVANTTIPNQSNRAVKVSNIGQESIMGVRVIWPDPSGLDAKQDPLHQRK